MRQLWTRAACLSLLGISAGAAVPVFTNTPRDWAVTGGEYEYIPVITDSVSLTVLQKPAWLTLTGSRLAGTPPTADEGLNPLVLLRASNGGGQQTDLSFRVRIGRLVGPVASPPGGGTKQWVTGMPKLARAGGDAELVTGVQRSDEFPIFWGLSPNGVGMKMNYVGPSGSSGSDFAVPANFTFGAAEILQSSSASPANLNGGVAVWQGTTNRPASIGGAPVSTYLRADAKNVADTVTLPFTPQAVLGVAPSVGALAQIPNDGDLRVKLWLNANAAQPSGNPALDWFNSLSGKNATDRTVTSFSSSFYWVNTPPTLAVNNGASLNQGGTVVLTTSMITATDKEDLAADIQFALGDGVSTGTPINGTLQRFNGSTWTELTGGATFTLADVANGAVRYVHNGSYSTSDGFQFRVLDAQGTRARDGDYFVFTFPIAVSLVNHPPVASNQSISVGLGATLSGTLAFSDPDVGYLPQTFNVSSAATPTLGTFAITNPVTGAFSFVSNGNAGSETIGWTVSDGATSATAQLTITIANQAPTVQPLTLSGSNQGGLTGAVTVNDPDLPIQPITLEVVAAPAKGTVQLNGLNLTYAPSAGRFGNDQFTIKATDSMGGISAVQTVKVSIRPGAFGTQALFLGGHRSVSGGGEEGVIQRVNPATGDVYTLATGLGREVRGLAWSEKYQKLIAAVAIQDSGSPMNGLVKVDALTGAWGFGDIVTTDGSLAFPLGVSNDGPDHVLVANGPGGVVRVSLADGSQQALNLGLPAGEFAVAAVPVGLNDIWVSSIRNLGTANDGSLFLSNRTTHASSTPVLGFSPAGDPAGLFLTESGELAVVRAAVPVEVIGLAPLSYTPHASPPSAPWGLPVSLTSHAGKWVTTDPFSGSVYLQNQGGTAVTQFTSAATQEPIAIAFGVMSVAGAPRLVVNDSGASEVTDGNARNLGVSTIGGPLSSTFVLRNTGTDTLLVSSANLTGTQAADFSVSFPGGSAVPPGASANMTVTFQPTGAGTRSATLTLLSNAGDGEFIMYLTGTGNTAPAFGGYSASTPWQTAASISLNKLLAAAADADGDTFGLNATGPASAQGGTAILQSGSILYTPPNGFSGVDTFPVTITDAHGATVTGIVSVTVGANPNAGGQGTNTPQLTMLSGGDVGIAFQGIPGRTYQIQRSTDLASWTTIAAVTAAENGAVNFTDENPPPGSAFYRLRKP